MKFRDIEFEKILKSHTLYDEIKSVLSATEYFDHITSLLCEHPYYNTPFVLAEPGQVSSIIQVNKTGVFKSAPGQTIICLQFNAFYLHCISSLRGKFISPQFPSIISDLYHYGRELKVFGKLDEYKAVKTYLNIIYSMVDRGCYQIYQSTGPSGSFMGDIRAIGNKTLSVAANLGKWLYMDTDYAILIVSDVFEYRQELYKYIPKYSWKIAELAQVAIVGKKQILAIDREFTYYPL